MSDVQARLAETLHAMGLGCHLEPDGRDYMVPTHDDAARHLRDARIFLAHLPAGLVVTTVERLAKEIPEEIGWLCQSDEQWMDDARRIGARLTCSHPEYALVTSPDMPWRPECRCVKCGSKKPRAIEHGRQVGSSSEGEG
jgi:hypothetical protein